VKLRNKMPSAPFWLSATGVQVHGNMDDTGHCLTVNADVLMHATQNTNMAAYEYRGHGTVRGTRPGK
jgi:hypothetical protein